MAFPKSPRGRSTKIDLRCFNCKESCAAKDGDWHMSPVKGVHQIFLCRDCEREAKVSTLKSLAPLY